MIFERKQPTSARLPSRFENREAVKRKAAASRKQQKRAKLLCDGPDYDSINPDLFRGISKVPPEQGDHIKSRIDNVLGDFRSMLHVIQAQPLTFSMGVGLPARVPEFKPCVVPWTKIEDRPEVTKPVTPMRSPQEEEEWRKDLQEIGVFTPDNESHLEPLCKDVTTTPSQPFALFKYNLATNRFSWGLTLSDAAKEESEEKNTRTRDFFFRNAKKLKRDADAKPVDPIKVNDYLRSAVCYLLGVDVIENEDPDSPEAAVFYLETIKLVQHAYNEGLQSFSLGKSQECRLAILYKKFEAYLNHRVYLAFTRNKTLIKFDATEAALTLSSLKRNLENISVDSDLVLNLQQLLGADSYLASAINLWSAADKITHESNNEDFFQAAASGSSKVWISTSATQFAFYVRETLFRIEKYASIA